MFLGIKRIAALEVKEQDKDRALERLKSTR